jgi:hypothetical protein
MIRPQPWHEEARRLHAAGLTYAEIGVRVGRHLTNVRRFLDPEAAERDREKLNARNRERYATDPAFRERYLSKRRAAHLSGKHKIWNLPHDERREQQKEQQA